MSHHQINNIWDIAIIGVVWLIGLAYKSIAFAVVWFVGLFNFRMSFDLVNFNEVLHGIVLALGGILTLCKLIPMGLSYIKGKRKQKRKFPKRPRK
jgi:hypothetical protein